MSINKIIMDTLKPIGVPVSFLKYESKYLDWDKIDTWEEIGVTPNEAYKNMCITFHLTNESGLDYSDDEETSTKFTIQVDVWSKTNYSALVENVIGIMKQAGFTRQSAYDLYESETMIFHKVIRFFYVQEN